jgi:CspA family cold shock protein
MPFRDTWKDCAQCGNQFVYRIEEQRKLDAQGQEMTPQQPCPTCRGESRAAPVRSSPPPPRRPVERGPRAPRTREAPRSQDPPTLGHGPHEGEVKWYSREKGYGFLVHPASGNEVFFHRSSLAPGEAEHVVEGMRVSFLIEESERGPQAVEVERLE